MTPHEISFTIFYLPATNGKAEESVKKGADMIEQYATSREQDAFKAGFSIAARDHSFLAEEWREVFKTWKGDTK